MINIEDISEKEKWFFESEERVKQFERSMNQSKEGKTVSRGSFEKYVIDDEVEEGNNR